MKGVSKSCATLAISACWAGTGIGWNDAQIGKIASFPPRMNVQNYLDLGTSTGLHKVGIR